MSTRKQAALEKATAAAAMEAESELRKASAAALKRAGLPKNLIERTKTLPGTLVEYREALAKLPDADRLTLRKAFKDFAGFPVAEFDKLTGAGGGENGRPDTSRPVDRHRRGRVHAVPQCSQARESLRRD